MWCGTLTCHPCHILRRSTLRSWLPAGLHLDALHAPMPPPPPAVVCCSCSRMSAYADTRICTHAHARICMCTHLHMRAHAHVVRLLSYELLSCISRLLLAGLAICACTGCTGCTLISAYACVVCLCIRWRVHSHISSAATRTAACLPAGATLPSGTPTRYAHLPLLQSDPSWRPAPRHQLQSSRVKPSPDKSRRIETHVETKRVKSRTVQTRQAESSPDTPSKVKSRHVKPNPIQTRPLPWRPPSHRRSVK